MIRENFSTSRGRGGIDGDKGGIYSEIHTPIFQRSLLKNIEKQCVQTIMNGLEYFYRLFIAFWPQKPSFLEEVFRNLILQG
jgi:hypothetical protein